MVRVYPKHANLSCRNATAKSTLVTMSEAWQTLRLQKPRYQKSLKHVPMSPEASLSSIM